jgi:DNA-binding beta-propeller fold protein YncE
VAVNPTGQFVYVVDQNQAKVQRFEIDPDCTVDPLNVCQIQGKTLEWGARGIGPGSFLSPTGIAVDSVGNVLVSDADANNVQVFDARGSHLRTFGRSGTGIGELNNPMSVEVAPDGMILVADRDNDRIATFTAKGEWYTSFNAGGQIFRPSGVAVGANGHMVVRDFDPSFGLPRVWRFDETRKKLWDQTIAGPEVDYTYPLQGAAFLPNGSLVLTDATAEEVTLLYLPETGPVQHVALRGREARQFDRPRGVALDEQFYAVSDPGNERVLVLDNADRPVAIVGGRYDSEVPFERPAGMAIRRVGPGFADARIYVSDPGSHSVYVLTPEGKLVDRWGSGLGSQPEQFDHPEDVAVSPEGEVFVADTNNHRIVRRAADGSVINVIEGQPGEIEFPMSVTVGPLGLVYLLEAGKNRVQAFYPEGGRALTWEAHSESPTSEPGEFWLPVAVTADDQYLYVMENNGRDHVRVQVFTVEKEYPQNVLTVFADQSGASPGTLWNPQELAVSDDGRILIADSGNNRLSLYVWPGEGLPATPTPQFTDTPVPTTRPTDDPNQPTPTAEGTRTGPPTHVAPTADIHDTPEPTREITPVYLPLAVNRS